MITRLSPGRSDSAIRDFPRIPQPTAQAITERNRDILCGLIRELIQRSGGANQVAVIVVCGRQRRQLQSPFSPLFFLKLRARSEGFRAFGAQDDMLASL